MSKTTRKRLIFGFAIGITVVAAAIWYRRPAVSTEPTVTIGAVLPLTGPVAQYGQYMKEGLELALDDAVAEGIVKTGEIRLVIEDGGGEPARSVSAFQKLLTADRPIAVVTALSGIILPIKPLANRNHVVILNGSSISTEIEDADDFSFSVIPNAAIEGEFLAAFSRRRGDKTAGIIYRNDASGKSFYNTFKSQFETLGGKIVFADSHNPNETDYRSLVAKVKAVPQMDVLFMASYGPEVAKYLQQALELDASRPVLAYTTFYSPKVLEIAGNAAEGVCFSAPTFDASSEQPAAVELRRKLNHRYGSAESNYYVASHYDAMMLVLKQIRNGARDGPTLRSAIASIKSYDGISGRITLDHCGAATIPLQMYKVTAGKFVSIKL